MLGPALRLLTDVADFHFSDIAVVEHHPPRDKEHHHASPKCRRESTPQTLPSVLQNLAIAVDDPVGR
jgi:hypothetical protein